jgi:hypothetical protein
MQTDYVLFFSNFCNYSKEVLGDITRRNIRNAFVLICIDSIANIPPFVTVVPLIACKSTKQIYVDDAISKILDEIHAKEYPAVTIEALPSSIGFQSHESDFEALGQDNMAYSMLDMSNFRITITDDGDETKAKKADSSVLEQYIANRDNDIKINDRQNLH